MGTTPTREVSVRLKYRGDNCLSETMAPSTARSRILQLFRQGRPRDPEDPLSFDSILEALAPQYTKGTISARLSELVDEGVLERTGRGKYQLVYAQEAVPGDLADLVGLLVEELPERTRNGTVVWDATPVLADSEDGIMAPVHVVETERFTGGSTARMLVDHWPEDPVPHIQEFGDRPTLVEAAFGDPPVNAPPDKRKILVGPAEGLYASTALHPDGVRLATPERVLADVLRLRDPALGEVIRTRLTSTSSPVEPDRLFATADERGLLPDLFAVLSRLRDRLPEDLASGYNERLHGAARSATEDRPR